MNNKVERVRIGVMKKGYLSEAERKNMRAMHRQVEDRRIADRFKAVLMRDKGLSWREIADHLMLDESTGRKYLKMYQKGGSENLLVWECKGGNSKKLAEIDENELKNHLENHTYQTAKEVIKYLEEVYGARYSLDGVTKLMKRLGFVHKQFSTVPAKADESLQKVFVEEYKKLKSEVGEDEVVLFGDATHPNLQVKLTRGWIKKGQEKVIASRSDRARLNLIGCINIADPTEVVMDDYKTINSKNVIDWFKKVERFYESKKTIHLILDGAGYFKSEETKAYLKTSKIRVKILPPYSPNLNPIERFWKFFNQKCRAHRDFETLKKFREATYEFFENLKAYDDILKSWITDNFQILDGRNAFS